MVKKVVKIITKEQAEKSDTLFWLKKTPEEKLSALQILREQYIRFFNKGSLYRESRKGLRKIYKVVKQTQGYKVVHNRIDIKQKSGFINTISPIEAFGDDRFILPMLLLLWTD